MEYSCFERDTLGMSYINGLGSQACVSIPDVETLNPIIGAVGRDITTINALGSQTYVSIPDVETLNPINFVVGRDIENINGLGSQACVSIPDVETLNPINFIVGRDIEELSNLASQMHSIEERLEGFEAHMEAMGLHIGSEVTEISHKAKSIVRQLAASGLYTSRDEINMAIRCISQAPKPDCSGVVQHIVAGVECAARAITGRESDRLSVLLRNYHQRLNLNITFAKRLERDFWGRGSDKGRHLRESHTPDEKEAKKILWLGLEALDHMLTC